MFDTTKTRMTQYKPRGQNHSLIPDDFISVANTPPPKLLKSGPNDIELSTTEHPFYCVFSLCFCFSFCLFFILKNKNNKKKQSNKNILNLGYCIDLTHPRNN